MTADTPDPRPVSPPSELTAEEVRATNALFEAMREAGLFGRKRQAVEDAAHHLAAVARAAACAAPQADVSMSESCFTLGCYVTRGPDGYNPGAAPQADANLDGYWERAYWEIVPKLAAALAAPRADTLRCGICDGREDDPYHGPEPCILCPHASSHHSFRAAPRADAGTLREAIQEELDLLPDEPRMKQFDMGAAAAYSHVLSLLAASSGREE
jgi:hypothetical protein